MIDYEMKLCVECGKNPRIGSSLCECCVDKKREDEGICHACGKYPRIDEYMCEECRQEMIEWMQNEGADRVCPKCFGKLIKDSYDISDYISEDFFYCEECGYEAGVEARDMFPKFGSYHTCFDGKRCVRYSGKNIRIICTRKTRSDCSNDCRKCKEPTKALNLFRRKIWDREVKRNKKTIKK